MIKRICSFIAVCSLIFSFSFANAEEAEYNASLPELKSDSAVEYFVATSGNDSNPGTIDLPFKTLEGAKTAIRNLKQTSGLPKGGITVNIRGGNYDFTEYTFVLDKEDSGTAECPIVYKRYNDEVVNINGGYTVDLNKATPVSDKALLSRLNSDDARANVRQINFKKMGVELGDIYPKGYGVKVVDDPATADGIREVIGLSPQIYLNGELMDLARYPNKGDDGRPQAMKTGSVAEAYQQSCNYAEFKYTDKRIERWQDTGNIWAFGWWTHDWAENVVKASIDKDNGIVKLDGWLAWGIKKDKRFYMENIFEELDHKNEYFYDYDTGIFYFYADPDTELESLEIAHNTKTLITLNDVSYVTLSGLNIKNGSGNAIFSWGGNNVVISYCDIRNIGMDAIINARDALKTTYAWRPYDENMPDGSKNFGVVGNHIYNIGFSAIKIESGNTFKLERGNSYVENNEIHRWGQIKRTYQDAVNLGYTCGARVAYNKIYDSPHEAISGYFTECLIEFNEIYDVCQETGDCGPIYTYMRDDTWGTVVRYNYIHDIIIDTALGLGATGVYLDGYSVGFEVYGNVFENMKRGCLGNGGCYNSFYNNLFVNCPSGVDYNNAALQVNSSVRNNNMNFESGLEVFGDIWYKRYPAVKTYFSADFNDKIPYGGVVKNNISVGSGSKNSIDTMVSTYGTVENNVYFEKDPGFVDMKKKDFRFKEDSDVWAKVPEWKNIPMGRIGLYGSYAVSRMKGADAMILNSTRLYTDDVLTSTEEKPYKENDKVFIPSSVLKLIGVESENALTAEETAEKLKKNLFFDEKTGLIMFTEKENIFNVKTDNSLIEEVVRQMTIR